MYMKMLLKQAYVPQVEGVDKIQARKSQVACVKLAGWLVMGLGLRANSLYLQSSSIFSGDSVIFPISLCEPIVKPR